jgi:hypothetical protein
MTSSKVEVNFKDGHQKASSKRNSGVLGRKSSMGKEKQSHQTTGFPNGDILIPNTLARG